MSRKKNNETVVSSFKLTTKPRFRKKDLMEYHEVQRCLRGLSRSTKEAYLYSLEIYCEFRGRNPKQLIDEAEEDRKKSRRHRGAPEDWLWTFYEYLLNDYVRTGGNKLKVGLSERGAQGHFIRIKSFYAKNGFKLDIKTPKAGPVKANAKLDLRPVHVRKLLDWCVSKRDRAIILVVDDAP